MPNPDRLDPERALRRVAELLRHDVRNPVYALGLSARILGTGSAATLAQGKRLSDRALSRVQRTLQQIELLTTFAADGVPEPAAEVSLVQAVEDAVRAAPDADVAVQLESRGMWQSHAELVSFALTTLLHNAATFATGPIRLRALRREGALLAVRIHHEGSLPDDAEVLFDPYRSAGAADNQAGVGLGLALSRIAARAHGGYVTVRADDGEVAAEIALPTATSP